MASDWLGLHDRIVVITGAGGGIGRAMALAFAAAGARPVLLDRDQTAAAETAALLPGSPLVQRCDVADPESVAGRHPQPWSGAYSVSKAGVVMLSQQLALEWGPQGVRSNVVSPGLVRTPMSEAFYRIPEVAEQRAGVVPLRRVATAADIADAAPFLASPRASYVNGEDLCCDGGFGRTLMGLVPRPGFDAPAD